MNILNTMNTRIRHLLTLALLLCSALVVGQPHNVTWNYLINADTTGNTLSHTGVSNGYSGAVSQEVLWANQDGSFEVVLTNNLKSKTIGFERGLPNPYYSTVTYGFYLTSTNALYRHVAGGNYYLGTWAVGDTLKVSRTGSTMSFIKNGQTLSTTMGNTNDVMHVQAYFNHRYGAFTGVTTSFSTTVMEVQADITNVGDDGIALGAIDLTVNGGNAPYSYAWSHTGVNTATINGLNAGKYTVTVTDNDGYTATRTFGVGYAPDYENFSNVALSGDQLYKTGGASWKGSASTNNVLYPHQDGWMEFEIDDDSKALMFGWSEHPNEGYSTGEFQDALYFSMNGWAAVRRGATNAFYFPYQTGDIFRIERTGTNVHFYRNGEEVYQRSTDNSLMIVGDVVFYNNNASLTEVRFHHDLTVPHVDWTNVNVTNAFTMNGVAKATVTGGQAPYTYAWENSTNTADSLTGQGPGKYNLVVTDANGVDFNFPVGIGYPIEWENLSNVSVTGEAIKKSTGGSWNSGATSKNKLLANTDGWIEYEVESGNFTQVFGFTDWGNASNSPSSIKYGFYIHADGTLYAKEGASSIVESTYEVGDILRVERVGSTVTYYQNGAAIRTKAVNANEVLAVDVALWKMNYTFTGIRCSFAESLMQFNPTITHQSLYSDYGSISMEIAGGNLPLTYSWSNGATTKDLDSLATGQYTLVVTDNNGNQATVDVEVSYLANFGQKTNVVKDNNAYYKSSSDNDWGNAGMYSDNIIDANKEGHVAFTVENPNADFFVGLSDGFETLVYDSLKYGVVIENGQLKQWANGNLNTILVSEQPIMVAQGDVIKLDRYKNGAEYDIRIHHNGTLVASYAENGNDPELVVHVGIRTPSGNVLSQVNGSFAPGKIPSFPCNCTKDRNYVRTLTYDDEGNIVSDATQFMDGFGQALQTQTKDFVNNTVFASNVIYDEWGRPVLTTMPAPIYYTDTRCLKQNFVVNNDGEPYSYADFDNRDVLNGVNTSVNAPAPVNASLKGTLGWYYSDNNTDEAYVAADSWPYQRIEYFDDPTGRVKRSSSPGAAHKMGSGHETRQFYMSSSGELEYVFGSSAERAYKVITIDAEGYTSVAFSTLGGKVVATASSGLTNTCTTQIVNHVLDPRMPTRDLHIPDGHNTFNLQLSFGQNTGNLSNFVIKLVDLETEVLLKENVDFVITANSPANYTVDLIGDYATGQHFLRFNIQYTDAIIEEFYTHYSWDINMPAIHLSQELDYSHWTLHYYDNVEGLLSKTIQPKGVDCDDFDPGTPAVSEYHDLVNEAHNGTDYIPNVAGNVLLDFDDTYYTDPGASLDHRFNFTLSLMGQDPELDDSGNGVDLYSPCEGSNQGYWTPTDDPALNLGQGAGWRNTATYLSNRSVNARQSPGRVNPIVELPNGNKLYLPGGPVFDPNLDCSGINHCYNGIMDTECGETGIDIGADCPGSQCLGEPDVLAATFRYEIEVYGVSSGGTDQQIDLNGAGSTDSYFFYPTLYRTCDCEYYWDHLYSSALTGEFKNGVLDAYDAIEFRLVSIAVQEGHSSGFSVLNPTANNHHDFARYMNFRVYGNYVKYEQAVQPTHDGYEELYTYNNLKQLASNTTPDEGTTEFVYDEQGQVRFAQDAQQLIDQKYSYTHYDALGRTVETGVFNYATAGAAAWQNYAGTHSTSGTTVFDVVDLDDGLDDNFCDGVTTYLYDVEANDFPQSVYSSYKQTFLNGQVSRSENDEMVSWYSYDEFARLRFIIRKIKDYDGGDKYFTMQYAYDFLGNLTQTIYQAEETTEALYHHYTYDNNQRLVRVETTRDGDILDADLHAQYFYYLHGALKRTELGDELQGLDYVYTLRGQLKSVNNPAMNDRDPGKDGFAGAHASVEQDIFAYTIDYYAGDYRRQGTHIQSFQKAVPGGEQEGYYDGNIRNIRWQTRTAGTHNGAQPEFEGQQLVYNYDYDAFGRLKTADFMTIATNGTQNGTGVAGQGYAGPTATAKTDYAVSGITYDPNGNLLTLKRDGKSSALALDNLTYHYASGKNNLDYVDDAVSSTAATDDIEDQNAGNYAYDAVGRMVSDAQGFYSKYDVHGRIASITADATGNNTLMEFSYDDFGNRYRKKVYNSTTFALEKEVLYAYDAAGALVATYEKDHTVQTPVFGLEDRTVYGGGRLGFLNNAGQYRYEISDHLGNIRAVITRNTVTEDLELLTMSDYYPYGMLLQGQNISTTDHRFGFQGKEKDETGFVNFHWRQYDPRLGRWLSVDPYRQHHSPYLAMRNNPILFVDPDGGQDLYYDEGGEYGDGMLDNTVEIDGLIVDASILNNPGLQNQVFSLARPDVAHNRYRIEGIEAWFDTKQRAAEIQDRAIWHWLGGYKLNELEVTEFGQGASKELINEIQQVLDNLDIYTKLQPDYDISYVSGYNYTPAEKKLRDRHVLKGDVIGRTIEAHERNGYAMPILGHNNHGYYDHQFNADMNQFIDIQLSTVNELLLLAGGEILAGFKFKPAAAGSRVIGGASQSAARASSKLPNLGRKLDFVFGKATGNAHNIQRSTDMLRNLNRIGIQDNAAGRALLRGHLNSTFNSTKGIIQPNGRVLRESLLMGPRGGVQVNSIWEGDKLITIMLKGGG